jgi:hypothetical protein
VTVTAPDVTVWWDATTATRAALATLRLTDGDVDAGRVAALADPAGQIINQRLDRDPVDAFTAATAPAQLHLAIVLVIVNLYRAKDQPAASIDGMMLGSVPPTYVDPLAGARTLIDPFRARRGVG